MPLNFGFFAAIFLGVFFYVRDLKFAAWTGIAYLCGLVASLIEIFHSNLNLGPLHFDDVTNTLFGFISIAMVIAMAERYQEKKPWISIVLLASIGAMCQIYWGHIEPNLKVRTIAVDLVAGSLMALTIPIIWRNRNQWIDKILFGLFIAVAGSYFARIIFVFSYLEIEFHDGNYETSQYILLLYFISSIIALGAAVAMLTAAAMDVLEKYREDSFLDPLTGLLNRRGFRNAYEDAESLADESGSTRFLLLFDLDYFKSINDEFGHPVGDAVLVRIGRIFGNLTQSFGRAARCGGEEFAVLLQMSDAKAVKVVVEHLALSFSMAIHPELPKGRKVTASFGVAKVNATGSLDHALQMADEALYRAKENGRNRIEFSENFRLETDAA